MQLAAARQRATQNGASLAGVRLDLKQVRKLSFNLLHLFNIHVVLCRQQQANQRFFSLQNDIAQQTLELEKYAAQLQAAEDDADCERCRHKSCMRIRRQHSLTLSCSIFRTKCEHACNEILSLKKEVIIFQIFFFMGTCMLLFIRLSLPT